jgi:hypothetical protein
MKLLKKWDAEPTFYEVSCPELKREGFELLHDVQMEHASHDIWVLYE